MRPYKFLALQDSFFIAAKIPSAHTGNTAEKRSAKNTHDAESASPVVDGRAIVEAEGTLRGIAEDFKLTQRLAMTGQKQTRLSAGSSFQAALANGSRGRGTSTLRRSAAITPRPSENRDACVTIACL